MAQIKIRFEINKGGHGAPLDKLAEIACEAERLLRMLADDLGLENKKGEWLAANFANESVSFDATFEGIASDTQASTYTSALAALVAYEPELGVGHPDVSEATLLQYSRLGDHIEPHERIGIGLYNGQTDAPKEWRYVGYSQTHRILQALSAPILAYGAAQGIIHALYKEAERPYFQLRDITTQDLVRCEYPASMYREVVSALEQRKTAVHVSGMVKLDRAKRAIVEMQVESIEAITPMLPDEFEQFLGCAPNMTGDMSTEDYIEMIRGGRE